MPPRDWQIRIEDILEACLRIIQYVGGLNQEQFSGDNRTIDAVVRNLTVIGEAARHIPDGILDRYPKLPLSEMRGIRNIVVHEYFGISIPILWKTIQDDIPSLVPILRKILKENP